MTWDLHADAAAISNASPAIKTFAQHVADILQPVTPPASAWPGNPWKTPGVYNGTTPPPIAGYPLDPHSDDYVANLVKNMAGAAGTAPPNLSVVKWSVPVYTAGSSDKRYKVTAAHGNINRFGDVPIPKGAKPDPSADGHIAILDYWRGCEYGMYAARYDATADAWSCDTGHCILFSEVNVPVNQGADDANIPLTAGLLTPEAFQTGSVSGPLVFACLRGSGTPRWPSSGGSGNTAGQYGPVNGMWMRLDPAYDVTTLTGWERQVARWLQADGMVCRDGSGNLSIYCENVAVSGRAAPAYPFTGNVSFSKAFPWNRMQVLAPPVPHQP